MINFYIYLAVIVSGASVLAIEILGTRIIAPFYGSSLYLWSALISVTLAALSLGYAIGGRWADRGTRLGRFCAILGLAGLWIALIPWLRGPVFGMVEPMELRVAVLIAAIVLFFPPLALLGMVSPYAIRMKASSLDVVGRTAGNLYAVSTVASVFAAVATGFFLIPNMGVFRLTFLVGVLLIATALAGFIGRQKGIGALITLLMLTGAVTFAFRVAPTQTPDPKNGVIAIEHSAYAEIRVVDQDDVRYMLIDGSTHTAADTSSWDSRFAYVNVMDIAKQFFDQPGDLLLVGLGGASVVKSFARAGWHIDAVEIDPVVTRMARKYFGLLDTEAKVYDMDGRQFLITSDKIYDLVIMDAYGSSSIPFHLVTEEAFGLVKSHLKPNGVLAANVETLGWLGATVKSMAATLNRQFSHVTVFPIAEPPDQFGNLVLMASDRELTLKQELPRPMDRFSPEYDRAHAWDNRFVVDTKGVAALTDDLNPIDIWSERVNLASRKQLHTFIDKRGIAW